MEKEIPIIIQILSGKTASLGFTAITVESEAFDNETIKQMIKKECVSIRVDTVEFKSVNGLNKVAFKCVIDDMEGNVVLNYSVNSHEYRDIALCFSRNNKLMEVSDNMRAVMLVKNIIDAYEHPMIEIFCNE